MRSKVIGKSDFTGLGIGMEKCEKREAAWGLGIEGWAEESVGGNCVGESYWRRYEWKVRGDDRGQIMIGSENVDGIG
jgi:hypothetical protein